jgi:hypothetical protein
MLLKDVQEEQRQSTKNLVFHGKTQNSMWNFTFWGKFNKRMKFHYSIWIWRTEGQLADIFTKPLYKRKFENLA